MEMKNEMMLTRERDNVNDVKPQKRERLAERSRPSASPVLSSRFRNHQFGIHGMKMLVTPGLLITPVAGFR
jgi:hypothetical protein